jgi:hypothetical protein
MAQIRAADIIQKLHFDPEMLETGLLQSMYQDTKLFLQFCDFVMNRLKERETKLQRSVDAFGLYAGRLAETEEGKHYLDLDGTVNDVCAATLQFSRSLRAQDLLDRNRMAQADLEVHKASVLTDGLRGGLDEVRMIYSDDPTLFALMLSSASMMLAEKQKLPNSLAPPR